MTSKLLERKMAIKHCIIHKLSKESSDKQASLECNKKELAPEDAVASLFIQLKQNLQKSATRQYGCFDAAHSDNPLPALIDKRNTSELGFVSMAHKISEHLKLACDDSEELFSSHLLFVVEELDGARISIFVLDFS
jgi:nucleoid-associated protein YejK